MPDSEITTLSDGRAAGRQTGRDEERPAIAARTAAARAIRLAPAETLLLGALIALAAAVYTVYALRVAQFQNDEEQYVSLARYVAAHFPHALWQSGIYPRGPQRLDPWILAIAFAVGRGPGAYEAAHAIQCVLFASAALPVYLLARGTGMKGGWAMLAATLSIVVPWSVVSASFLAESAAYPAYAWVLYAAWTAIVRPSPIREALFLAAVVIAILCRTAMLALVPILPLAVLWQAWSWDLAALSRGARTRRLMRRFTAERPVSAAMIVLGAFAFAADRLGLLPGRGLAALAGGYGLPHVETLSATLERFRQYLARAAVGTGFLALVVALPWTVAELVGPRSRERHATAVVCVLGSAAILLSLLQAGADERYMAYLAMPIALAAAAALSSLAAARPAARTGLGLLLASGLVVALVTSSSWPALASGYDFFSYPSAVFYQRVLLTHAGTLHLPLVHPGAEALIACAIVVATAAFVLALHPTRRRAWIAALLGVALVGLCLIQTLYTMKKFTAQVGGPTSSQRSWVDRSVPAGAHVGALGLSMGDGPSYLPIWRDVEFWNTSVNLDVFFKTVGGLPLPLGSEPVQLDVARASGLLSARSSTGSARPVPRWLLVPQQGTNRLGLHGTVVAQAGYLPVVLMRLATPPRIDWSIVGTSEEGFLAAGIPATVTVYNRAALENRSPCATFSLIAPPGFAGTWPFSVTRDGRVVSRARLAAGQQVNLSVPLADLRGATTSLRVRVAGAVPFAGGAPVSARLAFFAVASCASSKP